MATIRYGSAVKDKMTKAIVEVLTTIGYQVALNAYRQKTFQNRTYNLHDSYGSAVFVNGVLVNDSIKYVQRARWKKRDTHGHSIKGAKTGREALNRFFKSAWIVRKQDYITVVVAAAMWYADIVEYKGKVVLDEQYVAKEIRQRFDKVLPSIISKYPDLKGFEPLIRKYVGFDETYYRNL